MKFSKLLCAIPLITTAFGFSTVSCSNKYNIPKVTQQILDEFMGNTKKGITGIVNIPRPSNHCLAIQQYVYNIAKDNLPENSEVYADEFNNVYYTIPATKGCEEWKPIILQAHTDMVVDGLTEAQSLVTKIQPIIEEIEESLVIHSKDWKTSLGADNGIGLSMLLWITRNYNSFKHGVLRIICSADEEVGSLGAHNLTPDALKYNGKTIKYLINLDEEGRYGIARSCTGSLIENFYHTYEYAQNDAPLGDGIIDLHIDGLAGGHSAFDILKGHANADRLIFEFLDQLIDDNQSVQLISYDHMNAEGEDVKWASNALIRNGHVLFYCDAGLDTIKDKFNICVEKWQNQYNEDFSTLTADVCIQKLDGQDNPFLSTDDSAKIIKMIGNNRYDSLPFENINPIKNEGFLFGYSQDNPHLTGVPEGSFNIGPVILKDNEDGTIDFEVDTCLRSSVRSRGGDTWSIDWMKSQYEEFAISVDLDPKEGDMEEINKFEPWVYEGDNKLVDFLESSYKELGCEPILIDPPAYLEVAEWVKKTSAYSGLTCASIGVQLDDVHTIKEKVHIDTIENCFKVLLKAIAWMEEA